MKPRKQQKMEPDTNEELYEVENVVSKRVKKGVTEYLLKWKGYSEKDNTWEPLDNIYDKQIIEDYETEQLEKQKQNGASENKSEKATTESNVPQSRQNFSKALNNRLKEFTEIVKEKDEKQKSQKTNGSLKKGNPAPVPQRIAVKRKLDAAANVKKANIAAAKSPTKPTSATPKRPVFTPKIKMNLSKATTRNLQPAIAKNLKTTATKPTVTKSTLTKPIAAKTETVKSGVTRKSKRSESTTNKSSPSSPQFNSLRQMIEKKMSTVDDDDEPVIVETTVSSPKPKTSIASSLFQNTIREQMQQTQQASVDEYCNFLMAQLNVISQHTKMFMSQIEQVQKSLQEVKKTADRFKDNTHETEWY
ncbi:uncharacterized protein B4U80_11597 [Leptotrombidium deliense]|uniref:Chromo domain-containing protein n=1 Tax=Leptotrombidium deliense TaxID=299467 RepID=A0A443STS6_9ACAR|nr:uncharacterized protein B4U80_11597 [Leptotrombidium deliense]